MFQSSLRPVINATGVIVHTNLGRAPLCAAALEQVAAVGRRYSTLEYDLAEGGRGHRDAHAAQLLCRLTGAEAAVVVNNNAAATMLVLAALAARREVIVSRGRTGRNRRRVPRARGDGAVRRDPARGRHHEPHAGVGLRGGRLGQDGAHPARPSFELHDRGIHRAAVARANWSTSGGGTGVPVAEDLGSGNLVGGLAAVRGSRGAARGRAALAASRSCATSRRSRRASRPASTWSA